MSKARRILVAALALALLVPAAAMAGKKPADESGPWIHVEVREGGGEDASVNINLPLALAEAALLATDGILKEHMHIDLEDEDGGLSVSDLRQIWKAARDAGDAEFVTVQEGDETVRVRREGRFVLVDVDAKDEDAEHVRVRMPVSVMDALLAGEGEELDLAAAVSGLREMGEGELVRVEDGGDVVRIWIDDRSASADR